MAFRLRRCVCGFLSHLSLQEMTGRLVGEHRVLYTPEPDYVTAYLASFLEASMYQVTCLQNVSPEGLRH